MIDAAMVVIVDIGAGGSVNDRFGDFFCGVCGYGVVG